MTVSGKARIGSYFRHIFRVRLCSKTYSWDVGCSHVAAGKCLPVKTLEPGVLLDVCCPLLEHAKPLGRVQHQDSLHQILELLLVLEPQIHALQMGTLC